MYDKCYFCLDQLPKLKKESTASFFVNFGRSRGTKEPTYITVYHQYHHHEDLRSKAVTTQDAAWHCPPPKGASLIYRRLNIAGWPHLVIRPNTWHHQPPPNWWETDSLFLIHTNEKRNSHDFVDVDIYLLPVYLLSHGVLSRNIW